MGNGVWKLTPFGYLMYASDEADVYMTEKQCHLIIAILEEKNVLSFDIFKDACDFAEVTANSIDLKYLYKIFIKGITEGGYTV